MATLEAANAAWQNMSEKDNPWDTTQYLLLGRKEFFFAFLLHLRKKMEEQMQICLLEFAVRALHLWRRLKRECIPPACASRITARNCSEWSLPLSLPSSPCLPLENSACAGGGIVLICHRKSRGLSSAPSETAILPPC